MTHDTDRLADVARANFVVHLERTNGQAGRLATWLLVGNAGALVLVMKAVLDGGSCDLSLVRALAGCFGTGTLLAFGGWSLNYIGSVLIVKRMSERAVKIDKAARAYRHAYDRISRGTTKQEEDQLVEELESDFNSAQAIDEVSTPAPAVYALSWTMYSISALAFAAGASLPLVQSDAVLRSCAAAKLAAHGSLWPQTNDQPASNVRLSV